MEKSSNAISLAEMLSNGANWTTFDIESQNAHRRMFGSHGGPYSIDSMDYLTVALDCYKYARDNGMDGKPRFDNRNEILSFAVDQISFEGLLLEFGVASGQTINLVAKKCADTRVYGFDTFQGLPERWGTLGAGTFAQPAVPEVAPNVELFVGLFDRTLPLFLDNHAGDVAFLHVDCDLYYSTQTIFTQLRHRIKQGTIIQFDEYWNYPGWHLHEFLAFQQFVSYERLKYEYIALCPYYEQVAVRIL